MSSGADHGRTGALPQDPRLRRDLGGAQRGVEQLSIPAYGMCKPRRHELGGGFRWLIKQKRTMARQRQTREMRGAPHVNRDKGKVRGRSRQSLRAVAVIEGNNKRNWATNLDCLCPETALYKIF